MNNRKKCKIVFGVGVVVALIALGYLTYQRGERGFTYEDVKNCPWSTSHRTWVLEDPYWWTVKWFIIGTGTMAFLLFCCMPVWYFCLARLSEFSKALRGKESK